MGGGEGGGGGGGEGAGVLGLVHSRMDRLWRFLLMHVIDWLPARGEGERCVREPALYGGALVSVGSLLLPRPFRLHAS